MVKTQQAVHVARTKSRRVNKAGETVEYESVLLRPTFVKRFSIGNTKTANRSCDFVRQSWLTGTA